MTSKIKKIELIVALLVVAGIGTAIFSNSFCRVETVRREVVGSSMQGIFENGDTVSIRLGYYDCHEVGRGDIIAYRYGSANAPIIKRAVAIPGDTWSVKRVEEDKEVYAIFVNGDEQTTTLGVPYRIGSAQAKMLSLYSSPLGKDSFLILGNIPIGSDDSTRFGLVGRKDILGRVFKRGF